MKRDILGASHSLNNGMDILQCGRRLTMSPDDVLHIPHSQGTRTALVQERRQHESYAEGTPLSQYQTLGGLSTLSHGGESLSQLLLLYEVHLFA